MVVNEEVGVYTTGTIAVLFTSGHERVCRVSVVGGCTAILGTGETVYDICSVMTSPASPSGEGGTNFSRFVVYHYLRGVVVISGDMFIENSS